MRWKDWNVRLGSDSIEDLIKDAMMAIVMASKVKYNLGEMDDEASLALCSLILGEMVEDRLLLKLR